MALAPPSSIPVGVAAAVTTFDTRNGDVLFTAADAESVFTTAGKVMQGTGAGTGSEVFPPGFLIGYDQITASVTVASAVSPGTTIITCASHTFDGGAVWVNAFSPSLQPAGGDAFIVCITETGTALSHIAVRESDNSGTFDAADMWWRFTPTAGAHSYLLTCLKVATNGTWSAGTGTAGALAPSYIRFLKA